MSALVLAAIALITYASRRGPRRSGLGAGEGRRPPRRRMAAPIFASLATLTLVTADRSLAGGPVLRAALGALIMSPKRSLPLCLIGGVAGYAPAVLLS